MSQSGALTAQRGSGGAVIETLTGNSGGPVGPDATFNIDLVGNNTSGINIVGSPGLNRLTVVALQGTTTQRGTLTLATNAETIAGTDTAKAITSDDLKSKLGTQTLHGLSIGAGTTAALTWTAAPSNGQLLIGSTGADPVLANLTSSGGTITITNGAGTINLDLAGGTVAVDSFSPDSGTDPVVPTAAGLVNLKGSGSITTVGSLNTITTQLTGLTNHAVLVGAGTTTITKVGPTSTTGQVLQSAGAAADPAFSTATYPSTTTINQILYSSAANTVSGLATANRAVLTTGITGIPVLTALATDGQVIIGSTAGVPAAATLTAGANVSITNASNSITISANSASITVAYTSVNNAASPYTVLSTDYYLGVDTSGGTVTIRLPNAPSIGRIFVVKDKTGTSATNAITITTVGGAVNIDGSTSYTINTNYEAINILFNGTSYEVF